MRCGGLRPVGAYLMDASQLAIMRQKVGMTYYSLIGFAFGFIKLIDGVVAWVERRSKSACEVDLALLMVLSEEERKEVESVLLWGRLAESAKLRYDSRTGKNHSFQNCRKKYFFLNWIHGVHINCLYPWNSSRQNLVFVWFVVFISKSRVRCFSQPRKRTARLYVVSCHLNAIKTCLIYEGVNSIYWLLGLTSCCINADV